MYSSYFLFMSVVCIWDIYGFTQVTLLPEALQNNSLGFDNNIGRIYVSVPECTCKLSHRCGSTLWMTLTTMILPQNCTSMIWPILFSIYKHGIWVIIHKQLMKIIFLILPIDYEYLCTTDWPNGLPHILPNSYTKHMYLLLGSHFPHLSF